MIVVWASAFIVYQTTFISTPRLFVSPETGRFAPSLDIPEHALALRGKPNETDMRKHLLYAPLGRVLYRIANRLRLLHGSPYDAAALLFPQALYGATSVLAAYLLFLRLINRRRLAAGAACCYAFTYLAWLASSVPESYALTTLAVNLFLLFILREKIARWPIWCPATIGLITLCSLCDLRFVSLMAIPLCLAGCASDLKPAQRIGLMCAIVAGTFCLIGAAYVLYRHATGREAFGIAALWKWLSIYRPKVASGHRMLDLHAVARLMGSLVNESISPFHTDVFNNCPAAIRKIHASLVCCFWMLSATLILAALRSIRMSILSSLGLRALLCWLVLHFIQLHLVFGGLGVPHAAPLVLPLILLIAPGVVMAWEPLRFGTKIAAAAAAAMLANNLMLMSEARLAWQCPSVVQTPADCIYLLPGEIERARFLMAKISPRYSSLERERLLALMAKAPQTLSEKERLEMNELFSKSPERLTQSECEQLCDITYRQQAAVNLARKGA